MLERAVESYIRYLDGSCLNSMIYRENDYISRADLRLTYSLTRTSIDIGACLACFKGIGPPGFGLETIEGLQFELSHPVAIWTNGYSNQILDLEWR